MKTYKELSRCCNYFIKFAWKNSKLYFFLQLSRLVTNTIAPFISIIGTRYLIDELTSKNRELSMVVFWVAFICLGNYLYQNAKSIISQNLDRINERFGRILETQLSMNCINMRFEDTEDTEALDYINNAQRALNETAHVNGLIGQLIDIVSNVLVLLGVSGLICTSIPWLLIPVIISFIIKSIMGKKINKHREAYFTENSSLDRGGNYFNTELQDNRYAKDIRLYNTSEIFTNNYLGFVKRAYALARKHISRLNKIYCIDDLFANIFTVIIDLLLGVYAILGYITIGEFSSLFQATDQFNYTLHGIIRNYMNILYTVHILKFYVDFVEKEFVSDNNTDVVIEDHNVHFEKLSVEFKNVSFKYPRTDKYILKNVSVKINAGEHLSIVGQNGAGKTTFIKLLCRLYDDYEGEILVNDKNVKEYSFAEYMDLLSVVFQDFRLFAFTIKENVTVFNNKDIDLNETYKIAGIDKWIDNLENYDDTYIYKFFVENGIEPSGGESQKLAIARALYKNSPIVVLDEPTAALDPISEYEVYMNFDKLVENKTAVYISHRLSSCRFCDRIIVFNDGQIIEEGTHEELYNLENGFYANMYKTQAKQYDLAE